MSKNTLLFPSSPLPIVIIAKSESGNLLYTVEEGISTGSASGTLAVAVKIKNVSKRNATSHMAVISVDVDFFFIFILAIIFYFILI
jgi:hypothetical protein